MNETFLCLRGWFSTNTLVFKPRLTSSNGGMSLGKSSITKITVEIAHEKTQTKLDSSFFILVFFLPFERVHLSWDSLE